jgi:hypothetical protein
MICPEELSKDHPGLQDAYLTMLNSIVDELSLAHWKIVIDTNYEVDEGINQTPDTNKHAGKDQDLDIKRALKASLADQGKGVKRSSPTQGSSWAPMKKRRPTPELQPFPFPFRTPTRPHPSRSPSSSLSSSSGGQSSGHEFQAGNGTSALSICPQGTQSIPYEIESPVKPKGSNRKATTYSSLAVREAQDEDEM